MDENIKDTVVEEIEEQTSLEETTVEQDPLKDAIELQLKKIQRQNMLIGFQTACRIVFDKIIAVEVKPGKRIMNDYKRLIKELKQFCEVGVSRRVNHDGETEQITDNIGKGD